MEPRKLNTAFAWLQTSVAFKPRVPDGSVSFAFAQSTYFLVRVSPWI